MKSRHLSVPAASFLLLGSLQAQYFEARNSAMGGAGTASSHYLAAGWSNPALLTRFHESDDFGVILPTFGVTAFDKDGLIDDINTFVEDFDRIENSNTATQEDLNSLADQLAALDGRQVTGTLGLGFMLGVPSNDLGWSLHAKTFADIQTLVDLADEDLAAIRGALAGAIVNIPDLNSEARMVGVAITEVGLSLATSFAVDGTKLSLGATPKLQRIDTYNYAVRVNTFNEDDFQEDQYFNDNQAVNMDLGVAWEPGSGFTLGAAARNVFDKSYDTVDTLGQRFTYDVNPALSIGAAWHHGLITLTTDFDAVSAERFKTAGNLLDNDNVQLAHFGFELDLWRWLQLRGGYQTDLENTLEDAVSAGLGLSPFDILHIDVAGTYIDESSFGGVVQMALTF